MVFVSSLELRRRYASADLPAGSTRFLLDGVNHVALVSSDMRRTCDFYGGVLGLRLVKTIQLPGGGQHFFFDTGRGSLLAFFWWPQLQPGSPGVTQVSPQRLLRTGDFRTAIGTMNHVAWNVGYERLRSYRQILFKAGVLVSPILHHTDDPAAHPPGFAERRDAPGVYMSSIYFWGPVSSSLFARKFGPFVKMHNQFTRQQVLCPCPICFDLCSFGVHQCAYHQDKLYFAINHKGVVACLEIRFEITTKAHRAMTDFLPRSERTAQHSQLFNLRPQASDLFHVNSVRYLSHISPSLGGHVCFCGDPQDGEYLELIAQHSAFHPEKDVEHLPEGAAQLEEPRRPGRPGFDDDDD